MSHFRARARLAGMSPSGGPEVRSLPSLARAFRSGDHLAPERAVGKGTFEGYQGRRFG